jgi:flavin reductase (DIM6/NTAB) family NADH-FMN oxidoreductase RutF
MTANETVTAQHDEIDQDVFRRVVSHFASGVTIITTGEHGALYGTTASAVSSLSMDPPMMLVCLNRSSSTHDAIKRSGVFAINILAEGQGDLAYRFASKRIVDRFEGVDHSIADNGVPVLGGSLASIVCETEELANGGTHTVFLARVLAATSGEGEPLTYYRGKFGRLERVQEHEVYLAVRQWVLSRPVAPGQPINEAELVLQFGDADGAYVRNALIRLMTESLIGRDDEGRLTLSPITAELVDGFVDGRTAILVGVLDKHMHKATPEDLQELRQLAGRVAATRNGPERSLEQFLIAADVFHKRIVSVAGSLPLLNAYARLGMGGVWGRSLTDAEWTERMRDTELSALAEAIVAQRYDDARRAAYAHGDLVKDLARSLIAEHGGAI